MPPDCHSRSGLHIDCREFMNNFWWLLTKGPHVPLYQNRHRSDMQFMNHPQNGRATLQHFVGVLTVTSQSLYPVHPCPSIATFESSSALLFASLQMHGLSSVRTNYSDTARVWTALSNQGARRLACKHGLSGSFQSAPSVLRPACGAVPGQRCAPAMHLSSAKVPRSKNRRSEVAGLPDSDSRRRGLRKMQ